MGIGRMKQIVLVPLVTVQAGAGNSQSSYGTPFNTWAEITDTSGSRSWVNGQTQMETVKDFLIRFDASHLPTGSYVIRYDAYEWTIQNRIPIDEKRFYYRITAQAKGNV